MFPFAIARFLVAGLLCVSLRSSCVPWKLRVRKATSGQPLGSGCGNPGVRCGGVSCCSGGVANPAVRYVSAEGLRIALFWPSLEPPCLHFGLQDRIAVVRHARPVASLRAAHKP